MRTEEVETLNSKRGSGTSLPTTRSSSGGGRKRRRRSRSKPEPRKFWGNPETLPRPIHGLSAPPVTNAIPASLGRPPITGQETVSLKHLDAIYDRSVGLAFALATAGGLDLPAPEGEEEFVVEDQHNAVVQVVDSFNAIETGENAADGNKF